MSVENSQNKAPSGFSEAPFWQVSFETEQSRRFEKSQLKVLGLPASVPIWESATRGAVEKEKV
jgi:hypothetical protein